MRVWLFRFLVGVLALTCYYAAVNQSSLAQQVHLAPGDCNPASYIKLPTNTHALINAELAGGLIFTQICLAVLIPDQQLALLRIEALGLDFVPLWFPKSKDSDYFATARATVTEYICRRREGHSPAFMLTSLTNRLSNDSNRDPAIAAIQQAFPVLRGSTLKRFSFSKFTDIPSVGNYWSIRPAFDDSLTLPKFSTNTLTGKAVVTQYAYVLVDGEVAWIYGVEKSTNGKLVCQYLGREDSKSYNPRYSELMERVNRDTREVISKSLQVAAAEEISQFQSVKQMKLREHGVPWRTPQELNPDIYLR